MKSRSAILTTIGNSQQPKIKVTFPFSYDDLDKVRTLPARQYHSDGKFWSCPLSIDAVEMLQDWGFQIDTQLLSFLQKSKVHVNEVEKIDVPGLKGSLYPFQEKGVGFLEAKCGRALIGDEMGLGKTIQTLAWLQLHPELTPIIIVVPASLKLNWEREINMWMSNPGTVKILSGTTPFPLSANYIDIVIINYDILSAWVDKIKKMKPQVMILDEIHYTKNSQAKRTKAVKKLGKYIPHVIGLSGTPIVNRPIEIYNAINIIDRTVFPSQWDYTARYCARKYNGFGWDVSGASNTEELNYKLTNTIMLRRLKKDVLPDLPNKVRSYVPIELDNIKDYQYAERNFISFVKQYKGKEAAARASNAQALAEIEGLKQLAVRGKLQHCINWIHTFLESDEKLVVFATHKFVVEAIMKGFPKVAVKVDGSVTGKNRQLAVDSFQKLSSVRLFVGNIKAAGVGITLTAASNVAFIELPWTSGEVSQAEDRVHRIGQKNSVNIYYLLANETIEERIATLIDKKRKVLDSVLDGKITETGSLLIELINEYE